MLHRLLFVFVCMVMLGIDSLSPARAGEAPQPLGLKIGVIDISFAPYHIIENNQAKGPDIDVIRAVVGRIDSDFKVLLLPQKRATDYLIKGRIDLGVLFKMDRYRKHVVFGEQPLHKSTYRLAVLNETPFKFERLEDLYSHGDIGTVFGNSIGVEFDEAVAEGLIQPIQVNAMSKLPELLFLKRVKAVAVNERIFAWYMEQRGELHKIKFMEKPIGEERIFQLGISRKVKNILPEDLRDKIDFYLEQMLQSGEIEQIYASYGLSMQYYDPHWSNTESTSTMSH